MIDGTFRLGVSLARDRRPSARRVALTFGRWNAWAEIVGSP
jgi:hypothetical protein